MAQISLRAARINANMSRAEAAKILDVSVDTLHNWENGKTFPNVPQIVKIEQAYNIPYSDILFLPKDSGLTENTPDHIESEVMDP